MSKQKKLRNRLNDLFADIGQEAAHLPAERETSSGWMWECDERYHYRACSPEVEEILGFPAEEFIAKPLLQFGLLPQSAIKLSTFLQNREFPAEIVLYYQAKDGSSRPVRAHIFVLDSREGGKGLRGFNQVIEYEGAAPLEAVSSEAQARKPLLPDFEAPPPQPLSPPTPLPATMPRSLASSEQGISTEANTITIAGYQSLQTGQAIAQATTPDLPATLAVPIELQGDTLGILEIIDDGLYRSWNDDELRLVEEIADQLSLALENARLFQETQISLARTEALYQVGQAAIALEDLDELLQSVANTVTDVLPADRTLVIVCNLARQELTHFIESYAPNIPIQEDTFDQIMKGLTGWAIRERKPALSNKGMIDQRESEQARAIRQQSDAGSVLVVPLIYRDQVYGTLTAINSYEHAEFNQNDVDLLMAMSNQVATALANAQLFQEELLRRRIADTLSETARAVSSTLELRSIGDHLLKQLIAVIDFDFGCLQIIEGDQRQIVASSSRAGFEKSNSQAELLQPMAGDPLIDEILRTQKPIFVPDTRAEARREVAGAGERCRSWVAAPLISRGEVLGLIVLEHSTAGAYNEETADLLSAMAAQTAVAIRNARLFEQIQDRSRQLQTAAEVSRAASSILEPNPLIQQTVNLIRERFDLYYVGLFLVDEYGEWTREPGRWATLQAGTGEAGRIQVERGHKLEIGGQSMIGNCIASGHAQISQMAVGEAQRFINPLLPETRSEMALPLISRGQVIGAMTIQSTEVGAFSDEDISVLQTMADQVANALQNANLFDQTQARAEELSILNEMSRALTATLDLNDIVRNIYLFTSRLLDTSTFFVALYDEESNQISFPLSIENNQEQVIPSRPLSAGLTEYVIRQHQPLLITENVEGWLQEHGVELRLVGALSQSWLGVPMVVGERSIGIICVQNSEPYHYTEQHRDLLFAIASQSGIAIQNSRLFTQTQRALAETETLLNITQVASSSLEMQATLNEVLRLVLNVTEFDSGLISIADPLSAQLELVAHQLPDRMLKNLVEKGLEGTLCHLVFKEQRAISFLDLQDSPVDVSGLISLGFAAYQGVPLEARGVTLGTLCTFSKSPIQTEQETLMLLQAVGRQIGVALQNSALFEQTLKQTQDLNLLNEMGRVLASQFEVKAVAETVYEYTSKLMDTTIFYLALYDASKEEISFPLAVDNHQRLEVENRKKGKGLTEHILDKGETILISENVLAYMEQVGVEFMVMGDATPPLSWLGAPLRIGQRVIGVIGLQSITTPRLYNTHHRDLLSSIAGQAAISIQNAYLFEQTQAQAEELAILNEMSRELSNLLEVDTIIQSIYSYTSRLMDTTYFFIALYDEKEKIVSFPLVVENNEVSSIPAMKKSKGLTQHVIDTREALLISGNVTQKINELNLEQIVVGAPAQSWLGVPLLIGREILGVITVQNADTPGIFNEHHRDLLLAIARQSAIALQNSRLFEEVQHRSEELQLINRIVSQVAASLDLSESLQIIANELGKAFQVGSVNIALLNEAGNALTVMADFVAQQERPKLLGITLPLEGNPASQMVIETRQPLVIDDPQHSPLSAPMQASMEFGGVQTLIILPLILSGEVIGTVGLDIFDQNRTFNENEMRLIETILLQAATAIDNARLFNQVQTALNETQALYDASAALNAARTYDDILSVLRNYTILGINVASVSINRFDRPWSDAAMPDWVIPIARWHKIKDSQPASWRYPMKQWTSAHQLLNAGQPTLIADPAEDPRLDDTARAIYVDHYHAESLLFAPLVIANDWIGFINAIYSQAMDFQPARIRRLMTLIGQATVAIQNIQLLEETQRQLRDLSLISSSSQTLSGAPLDTKEVASIISEIFIHVMGTSSNAAVFLLEPGDTPMLRTQASLYNRDGHIGEESDISRWDYNLANYPATGRALELIRPLVIQANDPNADPAELEYMRQENVETVVIIPLAVKGQSIGVIELEYREQAYEITPEELNLGQTLANQAAVTLENARLYQEQRQTAEQLRELDKLKSQFLANMSHELRTPLNSIIGFSRVIMKGIDGPVTDLQQQDLSAIYNAGQHLLNMINDILDISKIEAGKMELSFEDVNLKIVIESVMSTARGLVKDKPIKLITAVAEDLPIITADSTRIRQVLLNLISNSAKFTEEGSITVAARQQISAENLPEIYISVTDTGIGIPPEAQADLFEPFTQVDGSPTRKAEGTGLGLSITRLLVELHGGAIGVQSQPGQGSTFFFTLPLPRPSTPISANGSPIILAIEDDRQVVSLYERYLSNAGYQVVPVTEPRQAVAVARQLKPFAITLDIMMPEYDGWRLLEDLKSDPEVGGIPIVVCTIIEERERGLKLGAADYLTKPILEEDLLYAINRLKER